MFFSVVAVVVVSVVYICEHFFWYTLFWPSTWLQLLG